MENIPTTKHVKMPKKKKEYLTSLKNMQMGFFQLLRNGYVLSFSAMIRKALIVTDSPSRKSINSKLPRARQFNQSNDAHT